MRKAWPVILYSILRLLLFVVPLAVLLYFPVFRDMWWIAVILAAVIGFSLSILLLGRQRTRMASQIEERNASRRVRGARLDAATEDDALDAAVDDVSEDATSETREDPSKPENR